MSWTMNRHHLIFIALVLCGDTNGFTVWNRTPVVDWQAEHSHISWNQNDQLSTPVQPSKLLARRGANVNIKAGTFSGVPLTSKVQTAQHDPSFVQSSGAAARDVSVLYAQTQDGPTTHKHDQLTSGPSRLYRFEPFHAENDGTADSPSRSAANTNLVYGSQAQSSKPSIANRVTAGQSAVAQSLGASYPSQMSGKRTIFQGQSSPSFSQMPVFQSQSSYQPSTATQDLIGQSVSTSLAQSSGASMLNQGLASGRYLNSMGQSIPSLSQSAVPAKRMSSFQTSSYQPTTTTQVLTGQSAGSHAILQGQLSPPSSQVSGIQTQMPNQPIYTTKVLTGQSDSTPLPQSSDASMVYKWPVSSGYNSQHPSVLSSIQPIVGTNQMYGTQSQSSEPSMENQVTAGQSAVAQSLGTSLPSQTSGRYSIYRDQMSKSPFRVSGFQTQSSYKPSTATQVLSGPSVSTFLAQSSGASMVNHGLSSGKYLTSMGQSVPSASQSAVPSNQMSEFQPAFSYQPSSATSVLASQSASASQTLPSGASKLNQSLTSGRYLASLGQSIPSSFQPADPPRQTSSFQTLSYQPSTTTQVLTGPSAVPQAQSSGSHAILQGQRSPSQLFGFQTQSSNYPSTATRFSEGQPASTSQAQSSGVSMLIQSLNSGRYITSMGQTVPSSQTAVPTSHMSEFHATASYPNKMSGKYNILQAQSRPASSQVPAFQTQSSYQPSTATQVVTGQSASASQAQSSGAFMLNQGLTSGRYLTSMGQNLPSFSQSAVPPKQTFSFQTLSYQPSTTTNVVTGQSTSTSLAQPSDASTMYELQASSGYNSQYQSVPSTVQSVVSTNQMYGSQSQSAHQPSTPPHISMGLSHISQAPFSSRSESSENAKWYTIMHPQTISASFPPLGTANQISVFQTLLSNQPSSAAQLLAGQPTITRAQSLEALGSYQSQTSGWNAKLQGQLGPSRLSGFQTQSSPQPSTTWFSAEQPASTSQAQSSGASTLYEGLTSGRYLTSMGQSIPSSSQSAVPTNQMSEFQTASYQPSTATRVSAGGYGVAQSLGASYPSQMTGKHTILQGQSSPSSSQVPVFQTQSSYQPSTATQVLTPQSAYTSQAQSSGASMLNQGSTSSRYLTSMGPSIPSAAISKQAYGSQTSSYQPIVTRFLPGQFASKAAAQSMAGSQKVLPRFVSLLGAGI